ncbi:MAG: class I SAM-dependent methyltransferase [Planctomycetota bacterium]|nr:MAG: class I SAM-dependent methyltransferase [Planctomycetota bacterium]
MISNETHSTAVAAEPKPAEGACLLCGQNNGTAAWEENGYQAKFCEACGVLYLDPAAPEEAVDATFEQHDDSYYGRPAKVRADWLATVRPSGHLLEVGCGSGHFLDECRRRGYEVAGCEVDPGRARYCREELDIEVETAYVEDSQLPEHSFDIVFHVDLLSHFPDPVKSLRAMTRLLKPGGVLCFEAGTLGGMSSRWYRWNGGLGCPDHRWFYSLDGIRNVIDRADLQIDSMRQYGLVPAMLPLVFGRTFVKPVVRLLKGKDARPWEGTVDTGAGPLRQVHGIYRLGTWVEFQLRYRLGPYVPKFGPTTLFIAASPK